MPRLPVIIVIEHQAELGQVLRDVLEGEGYEVVAVRDQFGAVGMLRQQPADLVVCDLAQTQIGSDPVAEITREFPDLPVLVLSDEDSEEVPFFHPWRVQGTRITLRKPFRLDDLVAASRAMIG